MDARKYEPHNHVSTTHFTTAQRQRLEALTAAKLLLPNRSTDDQLLVASFIVSG